MYNKVKNLVQINLSIACAGSKKAFKPPAPKRLWGSTMSKKPVSAEEQKKKQAYYSKGEKKAKAVKK